MSQRPELHEVRKKLWEFGHEVVSTWIDESGDYGVDEEGIKAKKIAIRDIAQISTADLFVLDTTSPLNLDGGGGREFEFGFAVGQFQHKTIWHVGPNKNTFHYLADRRFDDWNEVLVALGLGQL